MSERLPTVSGKRLISFLNELGYVEIRQRGSHVRLENSTLAGNHKITVPIHDPVAKGTLSDILSRVAVWCQISKEDIIAKLKE